MCIRQSCILFTGWVCPKAQPIWECLTQAFRERDQRCIDFCFATYKIYVFCFCMLHSCYIFVYHSILYIYYCFTVSGMFFTLDTPQTHLLFEVKIPVLLLCVFWSMGFQNCLFTELDSIGIFQFEDTLNQNLHCFLASYSFQIPVGCY